MYNIIVKKYGAPELLSYKKIETRQLKRNEVKIQVCSAGVNFADTLIIKGRYQERPRPPFSPGLEVAGVVLAVGGKVKKFKPGDKVMSIMKYGGYKQIVFVPEENTFKIPSSMPLNIAGGFPVAYGTAYTALVTKAKIKKKDTCLILGATGGVGIAAVEIAKAYNCRVIACGGDNKKLKFCINKGADFIINYNREILRKKLSEIGIKEIDVVIDMTGGQTALDAIKSLNWNGRIVIVGFASGNIPNIPANRLLLKNINVFGLYWGEYAYRYPKIIEKEFNSLGELYMKKKINPEVFKSFKLKEAPLALNYLLKRKNIGKIILECN